MKRKYTKCRFCHRAVPVEKLCYRVCLECQPTWKARVDGVKRLRRALRQAYRLLVETRDEEYACEICGFWPEEGQRRLRVDYDHQSKKVRGLLCARCDHLLARFEGRRARVERLSAYLTRKPTFVLDLESGRAMRIETTSPPSAAG